jgi:hypothetical protein
MNYKYQYLKYKNKYIQLKTNKNNLIGGNLINNQTNKSTAQPEQPEQTEKPAQQVQKNIPAQSAQPAQPTKSSQFDSDSDSEINIPKKTIDEQQAHDAEIQRPKVDQGKGIIGDLITNKQTSFFQKLFKPSSWDYVEPTDTKIIPEKIEYTDFNQELIDKIYMHKNIYKEGYDIGYIIGYECGVNLDYASNRKDVPGNISDPEFIAGFMYGWKNAFSKGKKYYYTTYIQLNSNNNDFQEYKLEYLKLNQNIEDKLKSNPNYDEIESKNYDTYYVKLKKILLGKPYDSMY